MKVIGLRAENYKILKAVEIHPDGNVVRITGKNASGKSTVLEAIWRAVGGGKMPDKPIRDGAKSATIRVELGDNEPSLIVTRKFTASGTTLEVANAEGAVFKSPQAMLDKLIGKLSFDPLAFAEAPPAKQVEMLLSVIDLRLDPKRLREMAGLQFPWSDSPLENMNNAYRVVFENRTALNRTLDSAKKVLASIPPVDPVEPVSVADLFREKEQIEAVHRENDRKREILGRLDAKELSLSQKVEKLRRELQETEAELREAAAETKRYRIEVALLEDPKINPVLERIANADAVNAQAAAYQKRQEKAAEVEVLQVEADSLTSRLEMIRAYKEELVAGCAMPLPGLDFAGGGVTYLGQPFSQASTAQRIHVSIAVAMALHPGLRVIRLENGSLLDPEHLETIERLAQDQDFQVWVEQVGSGEVGILIEDGSVVEG